MGLPRAGLADHHRSGGDADPDRQFARRIDLLDRPDDLQPDPDCPLRIVLMGARPTEISHQTVAQILGDTLARKAANGARALNRWAKGAADSGAAGVAETLVEETRLLASRPRAERFVDDVETLRDGTARLQQRIERLRAAAKPG